MFDNLSFIRNLKAMGITVTIGVGLVSIGTAFSDYLPAHRGFVKSYNVKFAADVQRDVVSATSLALDTQFIIIKQTLNDLKTRKDEAKFALGQATDPQLQKLLKEKIDTLDNGIADAENDKDKNLQRKRFLETKQ